MDKGNKVLLNNITIGKNTNLDHTTVSKIVSKLVKNKIVLRQKLDVSKYEYSLNYDVINPQLAFKGII